MPPQILSRAGTRLALWDLGGDGPPALLVHGLAGHAEEWSGTAAWLSDTRHIYALDLRGHGLSETNPADVSPDALRDDVCFALEQIGPPAVLLGHSLGGRIAIPAAAARPDLVESLIVAEAGPDGSAEMAEQIAATVANSLRSWPVPFPDSASAEAFFAARGPDPAAWTCGLRREPDGLHPRFEVDVLERMLAGIAAESCWDAWSRISRPTLIVHGERGDLPQVELARMLAELPGARCAEAADAAHELHLEQPALWRAAVAGFLEEIRAARR
jgi:pimeloyl-ACP methyl ester carboxylesterase